MVRGQKRVELFSPAKINLYLAVTGIREDGFHDLVSLVAPVSFGDTLEMEKGVSGSADKLICNYPDLPTDETNLVLQAAKRVREFWNPDYSFVFYLEKHIPMGAGLGGGSSNAVAALKAMQGLSGGVLSDEQMFEVALALGSDCPLFLDEKPRMMRGRGERLESIAEDFCKRLRGRSLILFKPSASISTLWAYNQMKTAGGAFYTDAENAESELLKLLDTESLNEAELRNDFEPVVFQKYAVFPVLFERLRSAGYQPLMSGSGSAGFVLLSEEDSGSAVVDIVMECLGEEGFLGTATVL